MDEKMSAIEIKADTFRIIRANATKPVKTINRLLREHFKLIATPDQVLNAIKELKDEM